MKAKKAQRIAAMALWTPIDTWELHCQRQLWTQTGRSVREKEQNVGVDFVNSIAAEGQTFHAWNKIVYERR